MSKEERDKECEKFEAIILKAHQMAEQVLVPMELMQRIWVHLRHEEEEDENTFHSTLNEVIDLIDKHTTK